MPLNLQTTLLPGPAYQAGAVVPSQPLTVSGSAQSFTAFPIPETEMILIDVVGGPVRVRWDQTAPTSTVGHRLYGNQSYVWLPKMFGSAQFILDSTAASATLFASALSSR